MAQKTKFIKTKAERTIVNTKPGKIIDIIDSSDNKKNISSMKKKVVNTKPGEVVEVIDTVSNAKKTSSKKIKKQLIVSKKPSTSRSTISKSTAISVPKNFPNNARLVSSSSRVISDGSSKKSNATVVVNIFESRGEERGRTVSNNVVSEQVPVAYVNDTNTSKIIKNNVRQVVQEENDEVIVAPKKKKHFP
jgi:hypothetical protein